MQNEVGLGISICIWKKQGRKEGRKKYILSTYSISLSGTSLYIYSFNKYLLNSFLIDTMCPSLGSEDTTLNEVNRVLAHKKWWKI